MKKNIKMQLALFATLSFLLAGNPANANITNVTNDPVIKNTLNGIEERYNVKCASPSDDQVKWEKIAVEKYKYSFSVLCTGKINDPAPLMTQVSFEGLYLTGSLNIHSIQIY